MTIAESAKRLDEAREPVSAMWAYEVAIAHGEAEFDAYLALVALYFAANDPGFFSHHGLHRILVDELYGRAVEVLAMAKDRWGDHPEIAFWQLHFREHVLGEAVPIDAYRELARQSSAGLAQLMVFLRSDGQEYRDEAHCLLRETTDVTERGRYILSFRRWVV